MQQTDKHAQRLVILHFLLSYTTNTNDDTHTTYNIYIYDLSPNHQPSTIKFAAISFRLRVCPFSDNSVALFLSFHLFLSVILFLSSTLPRSLPNLTHHTLLPLRPHFFSSLLSYSSSMTYLSAHAKCQPYATS